MADCEVELSSPTIPLLTNCFGNGEYVLIGNAIGGWGDGKYAKRNLIDIIYCTLPFSITSADFEPDGQTYLNSKFQDYQVDVFLNNINRFVYIADGNGEYATEAWNYVYDINDNIIGIKITIGDFNSNTDNKNIEIFLKSKYSVPVIFATAISNETDTTANTASSVMFNGNGTVSDKGFCWSVTPNPKITDSTVSTGSGIGAIVGTLTGLSPSTEYYVRAYATNEYGTGYGAFTTFTTAVAEDLLLINNTDSLMINSTDSFIL